MPASDRPHEKDGGGVCCVCCVRSLCVHVSPCVCVSPCACVSLYVSLTRCIVLLPAPSATLD